MRTPGIVGVAMLAFTALAGAAPGARAAEQSEPREESVGRTPPRLSFVDGQVSFWRPGAQDWAQAQINTPMAPGDELYTGSPGNLELQIGSRAFIRAWANSQLGLANQEPDFLQIKVTAGHVSVDLRSLEPGRTVEVDTPSAAFTIEHAGYYRLDVAGDRTLFITRRGGRATVTPPSGEAAAIAPSEEVVVEGDAGAQVASYVAPPPDEWDTWNYARTDALLEAVSARYVSSEVYGVRDLDRYGSWRVVPTYGSVWVPAGVPVGWVPYSTGSWVNDPYYGWTWVDTASWGWAPYHYGRWVFVDGFWAWAPGPILVRPAYAPALVAFFGGPGVSIGVTVGAPVVGWVALGWGEPLVPWWGPPGFVHLAWWGGWGGPRVVNNVVIDRTTVVNVQNITVYRNITVQNAVVAVNEQHFGHGPIGGGRVTHVDAKNLRPLHGAPQVAATPASFEPTSSRGIRPPREHLTRPVVATRPPHVSPEPAARRPGAPEGLPSAAAPARLVSPPKRESALASPRPPFGQGTKEREAVDRPRPPSPPKFETQRKAPSPPQRTGPAAAAPPAQAPRPPVTAPQTVTPRPEVPRTPSAAPQSRPQAPAPRVQAPQAPAARAQTPQAPAPRVQTPQAPARVQMPPPAAPRLPGEPANRLYPGRSITPPARGEVKTPAPAPAARTGGHDQATPGRPAGGKDRRD